MSWTIIIVGAKAKTLPFAPGLHQSRRTNEGKTTGEAHPSSYTPQDEGPRRGRSVPRPHPTWRPTWDSTHCNRPRTEKCVTGPICNGFSLMTVCNPPLWEYSGDDFRCLRAHASLHRDVGHSGTYKYPCTVPLRGWINRAIAISS
jgi:hypothetical protein